MNLFRTFIILVFLSSQFLTAGEFTIASYNCGGLSEHYDYIRAASMQKMMQQRSNAEPEIMALNEEIQKLALRILFTQDIQEQTLAQQEWQRKGYDAIFKKVTAPPTAPSSINKRWHKKMEQLMSSYQVRPVTIFDSEVNAMLEEHIQDLSHDSEADRTQLTSVRALMAKRIFAQNLKYDIICLQEADYLDESMFPANYKVLFAPRTDSANGLAWNVDRFEHVETIGTIQNRAFAVLLRDKLSQKTVLIVSGHLTGCNPYATEKSPSGDLDSAKGDNQLRAIVKLCDSRKADFKIIGMDSNVTSLHPRLHILKDANFQLDAENFIDPTCANPYQVLNTRIDWIALKSSEIAKVINIPVLNVGLNSIQTNMSDHKPIAAKIIYK